MSATLATQDAHPPAATAEERSFVGWSLALLLVLGALLYWSALDVPFLLDDWPNIVQAEHSHVHRLWPWGPAPRLARCLGTWTFQLNYAVSGLDLTGFH